MSYHTSPLLTWLLLSLTLYLSTSLKQFQSKQFGHASSKYRQSADGTNTIDSYPFNLASLDYYASLKGIVLKPKVSGIVLRLEAFSKDDLESPIGYLSAFIRPLPLGTLHLDTIQVKNRRQNIGYRRRNWRIDGSLITFVMGSWALCWAQSKGCNRAELLAVKDSDMMHMILVRLYQSFGFDIMREVGDSPSSIPDRLLWGAVGTLMNLDMKAFFHQWTPKLNDMIQREIIAQQSQEAAKPS